MLLTNLEQRQKQEAEFEGIIIILSLLLNSGHIEDVDGLLNIQWRQKL